jgi:hypothetical protein
MIVSLVGQVERLFVLRERNAQKKAAASIYQESDTVQSRIAARRAGMAGTYHGNAGNFRGTAGHRR